MSLQEKEKKAAEEAEKRLKAALTAKREPSASTASRIGSPNVAEASTSVESEVKVPESKSSEDVTMDGPASETTPPAPAPPEVSRPEKRNTVGSPKHDRILGCQNYTPSSTTSRRLLPVTQWKLLGACGSIYTRAKSERVVQSGILSHILAIVDVRSISSDQQVRGREQHAPGSEST